jgi:hypothetical protein
VEIIYTTGVVTHACNSSTWEAEAGGSRAQGQPGLHSKTLYPKKLHIHINPAINVKEELEESIQNFITTKYIFFPFLCV